MTLSLAPSRDRARTGVLVVLVAQLMLVLDATVVNVALPRIDADLGFGPASLSWVLNAYTLAFGGLLLLGGRLGDVRGRLRVAVIVSVYAAGAVPGEFLPGAQAAFLTSALFSATAGVIAATAWFVRRRAVAVPDAVEAEALAGAA